MWILNSELGLAMPEIFIASMACLILILDRYMSRISSWMTYVFSQVAILGAFVLNLPLFGLSRQTVFNNTFVLDSVGVAIKLVLLVYAFFVFMYARKYLSQREMVKGEYFVLSLFSIFGMMVLISASHFMTLYLGLELLALPLYALIAFNRRDKGGAEAAMKYFVMGALASGMLLYGISILYGVTGSLGLTEIASILAKGSSLASMPVLLGLVFIMVGLAFKFGAVPFHMWVPDVYQGSMSSVTLFIATLPELAAFGMAIRLLQDSFVNLSQYWQPLLIVMAVLSLLLGNIAAIAQANLKRMLAYSTIGHMGFVFLGLIAGPEAGYAAAFAYVMIYSMMALAALGVIMTLSRQGFEADSMKDFQGLGSTQPWIACLMLLVLLSLAGIPPTVGFYAKFMVLDALLTAGTLGDVLNTSSSVWLVTVAVITSVIAAFYYLRVVRVMFFEAKPEFPQTTQRVSGSSMAVLSLNGLAMLFFGIYPAPIINFCLQVFAR